MANSRVGTFLSGPGGLPDQGASKCECTSQLMKIPYLAFIFPFVLGGSNLGAQPTIPTFGLMNALAFTAHPQVNPLVVGDGVFLDPSGRVSDILRFNPATSSASGLTQLIFFYSNDHAGLLADTGLPASLYGNSITIQENPVSSTIYTPTAGQPGLSTDTNLGDSFHIFSTPDTGSTLLMLGVAVVAAALFRRKILIARGST
jgi:hypothetical protein